MIKLTYSVAFLIITICFLTSIALAAQGFGDIDGSGKVDIFDYNLLLVNFGKTGSNLPGDLDNNDKVDIFDYNILLVNFGKSVPTPTPATTSTPTPANNFSANDPKGEDRCNNSSLASVNIKTDFGAKGDGTSDDGLAFKNAIATGKKITIPSGTYILSQVDVPFGSTMILCGAGKGLTILKQKASPSTTAALFSSYGYNSQSNRLDYLEIQNLTLDGNKSQVIRRPSGSSMTNYGILHVMARKMLLANSEIKSGYHGFRILDISEEAIIRDNWFHDMALVGDYLGSNTHNMYISKAWDSNSTIWIDRNLIEACGTGTNTSCTLPGTEGGRSAGGLLFSPGALGPIPQQLLRIKDNTWRNVGMNMLNRNEPEGEIYIYENADNLQILGNQFINSYLEAMAVFNSNNVEIAYNTIIGNGVPTFNNSHMEYHAIGLFSRHTHGPYFDTTGWNIHHNTIRDATYYKVGICACFSVDTAGFGRNIKLNDNVFINNLNGFGGTGAHTLPIDIDNAFIIEQLRNDLSKN